MSQIIIPETQCTGLTQEIARWLHAKFGPNPEYDSAKERDIGQWGLPWFRAGALVIDEDNKILMIHEGRVHIKKVRDENYKQWLIETHRCDAGGWADGDGGWNIPAGRLALGESFEEGVVREVKEESGHDVKVLGIIHVRWGKDYVMPTFLAQNLSWPLQCRVKDPKEVIGICNFSVEGVRALDDAGVLRSPESVMDTIDAYEAYLQGEITLNHINPWPGDSE